MWFRRDDEDDIEIYEANSDYDYGYDDEPEEKRLTFASWLVIAFALYISFLGIGFFSTNYLVDESGKSVPQVANVAMREDREVYRKLNEHYLILCELMEQCAAIDAKIPVTSSENLFLLATEYESLLPVIDKQITRARGLAIPSKYNSLKTQIATIYDSVSIYLQKMGTALTEKNSTALSEAISWQEKAAADLAQFEINMQAFADMVRLARD